MSEASPARLSRAAAFVSSRAFHALVLAAGLAFILTGAFHGNVWFDESYSVGIAQHSFAEIWDIGSGDVHPVLFYWGLHLVYLVFGANILAFRLFAVAGTFMLAALGLLVIRRDFGWKVGVLFSVFALFTPYVSFMAVEIRMYSWASFTVMLCALFAWRIACVLRAADEDASSLGQGGTLVRGWWSRIADRARERSGHAWCGVSVSWWVIFFAASLASAYLHYYGVLSAFLINAFLLAYLVWRCVRRHASPVVLVPFALGALVQVVAYLPWLSVVASQVGVVSGSYWANVTFPRTLVEWAFYPIMTSHIVFADTYGSGFVVALWVCALVAIAACVWGCVQAIRRHKRAASSVQPVDERGVPARAAAPAASEPAAATDQPAAGNPRCAAAERAVSGKGARLRSWILRPTVLPALLAAALYMGVFAVALAASIAMDSLIVYYRYLSVAIGALLFAVALALSCLRSRVTRAGLLAAFFGVAVISQMLFTTDAYSEKNQESLSCLAQAVAQIAEEQAFSYEAGLDALPAADSEGAALNPIQMGQPLVLSADIGFEGVSSVTYPSLAQTFLAWQPGNWAHSYLAYAPTLTSVKSWNDALGHYTGQFVVVGQTEKEGLPRDVTDLDARDDVQLRESHTFYRPYERTWFTVAVMEKN